MTNKELYNLTKYLFESWDRGADYDNYHMDCQYVLEALAQPEQKPFTYYDPVRDAIRPFKADGDIPLYTSPPAQPEQEPVGFKCIVVDNHHPNGIPFEQWVKPLQRKWVGLTDDERAECWRSSAKQSAINIEVKLKEKNT